MSVAAVKRLIFSIMSPSLPGKSNSGALQRYVSRSRNGVMGSFDFD